MSLAKMEDSLFDEWDGGERLVRDGAVDAACYEQCARKVLFVLKEANDPGGGAWDLRGFLRAGQRGRGATWHNVARWAEGIRCLPCVVPWSELERRKLSLRSIVAVNLKKVPGGSNADIGAIRDFAHANREILRRQFALYKPDLVVGCGRDVSDILFGAVYDLREDWAVTSNGIWHAGFNDIHDQLLAHPARYVAYWHPGVRWPANLLHYGLTRAVAEAVPIN